MEKRYLEDFEVGETFELGSCHVSREEILEFARRYDPQPFQVDEEAARQSIYGGLIASGWHTTAMLMRLLVDGMAAGAASMGSPGTDGIRWLKPVRPGDTLSARAVILDVVPSRSKPDRGHMRASYEVFNQKGEKVMTMISRGIYARRPASRPAMARPRVDTGSEGVAKSHRSIPRNVISFHHNTTPLRS